MKTLRTIITAVVLLFGTMTISAQRMSLNAISSNARFLTDRMAYTLGIHDPYIIDDIYRINYDYIYGVNNYLDEIALGYYYDDYIYICEARDLALRNLLGNLMWERIVTYNYFHRPIVFANRGWHFSIYDYDRRGPRHFYYKAPHSYGGNYRGGHFFGGMAPRSGGRVGGVHPGNGGYRGGRVGMDGNRSGRVGMDGNRGGRVDGGGRVGMDGNRGGRVEGGGHVGADGNRGGHVDGSHAGDNRNNNNGNYGHSNGSSTPNANANQGAPTSDRTHGVGAANGSRDDRNMNRTYTGQNHDNTSRVNSESSAQSRMHQSSSSNAMRSNSLRGNNAQPQVNSSNANRSGNVSRSSNNSNSSSRMSSTQSSSQRSGQAARSSSSSSSPRGGGASMGGGSRGGSNGGGQRGGGRR